jgi:hypothetical protein
MRCGVAWQVARGRHVKFLSMGKGWDVAMQPWAFPITNWMAGRSVEQTQHKAEAAEQKGECARWEGASEELGVRVWVSPRFPSPRNW